MHILPNADDHCVPTHFLQYVTYLCWTGRKTLTRSINPTHLLNIKYILSCILKVLIILMCSSLARIVVTVADGDD